LVDAFPAISHEDLLKLVFSVGLLLATARGFGEIARRLGQPAVVGEILAGVVLGPSLLSSLVPAFGEFLLPQSETQSQLLDGVALLGIIFLMVVVGLETDLGLIRARWRTAAGVGFGGLVVPFGLGFAAAWLVPEPLLGTEGRLVFSLFLAVALALSAIPVLAKILSDLGLLRREFGQTALAAGMIDDICGWGLLGMVISLAASGSLSPAEGARTVGALVVFLAATALIARPVLRWGLSLVRDRFVTRDMTLTLVVAGAFAWGAFSQWLHLEPILGAFAVGVICGQVRRLPVDVTLKLESVTNAVLAPLFLATAGLRLRLDVLAEPDLLLLTGGLFLVAAVGKLAGGYLGGRYLARTSHVDALGYGIALNARGVLGIVVATIGLSMGIFGVEVYSMVVLTSLVTSVLAPVGLKRLFPGAEDDETPGSETLPEFTRVLLPMRVRDDEGDALRALEAAAIAAVCAPGAEVLLLSAVDERGKGDAEKYLREVRALFPDSLDVRSRVVKGDAVETILATAARGYDLLALGAPEPGPDDEFLFSPAIDDLVRLAPCPSLVFTARGSVWPPRTILVPIGGGPAAAKAADLAYAIAKGSAHVLLFHVIDPETAPEIGVGRSTSPEARIEIGHEIVADLRRTGERLGVHVGTEVVMGEAMTTSLIERAERSIDLVIVGTNARSGTHRLFLGPKVEHLVAEMPCSLIVLNV